MGFFKSLLRGKSERAIYYEYEALFDEAVIQHTLISSDLGIRSTTDVATDVAMQKASSQVMQKYRLTREEMLDIIVKGTTKWSSFKGLSRT
jgi:hypothetical protein